MIEAPQPRLAFYEFEGIRFYTEECRLVRLLERSVFFVRPKERDFLVVLLSNPHTTVTYEELRQKVWPEAKELRSVLPTIRETKHTIDKLLGDITKKPGALIETVARQGYRLNADVKTSDESSEAQASAVAGTVETAPTELVQRPTQPAGLIDVEPVDFSVQSVAPPSPGLAPFKSATGSLFGTHPWHIVVSCALYSLLYASALLLEVSYQFDRFGSKALKIAPFVFCGVFATSATALALDRKLTFQDKGSGFLVSILMFVISAAALFGALCFFLPSSPITESSLQTYPAQAAYLKDESYFLILALFFIIIPAHFIATMEREKETGNHRVVFDLLTGNRWIAAPKGALYPRFWALAGLLLLFLVMSVAMSARLLDNLKPGPYQNLFVQLVYLRGLLFFGLGVECLIWYYRALEEIKRRSSTLHTQNSFGVPSPNS